MSREILTERGRVTAPPPGIYRDPSTGAEYRLYGFLGYFTASWGGASGWPGNWQDLELVHAFPETMEVLA